MNRFTIDGDEALERHLGKLCGDIGEFLSRRIPPSQLQAIVLGGGYGRGEGGVLASRQGDRPYNDLEFYVFLAGHPAWQERRYGSILQAAVQQFEPHARGLHLEFKIDSLRRFRRRPISMFSYDLVAGHRRVVGPDRLFADCPAHHQPRSLPLSEATRLLFNRCSGLLLARQRLAQETLDDSDCEFVARNLAKARLAFGDAVLAAEGQYHWSCRERHRRLQRLETGSHVPHLNQVVKLHQQGVAFKLHPEPPRDTVDELRRKHRHLSGLGKALWLWSEERRLNYVFATPSAYALSTVPKCPEQSPWQSRLAHCRRLGPSALYRPGSGRYPRERLFHSLSLLLWEPDPLLNPQHRSRLQQQLGAGDETFAGLVTAYEHWWTYYG